MHIILFLLGKTKLKKKIEIVWGRRDVLAWRLRGEPAGKGAYVTLFGKVRPPSVFGGARLLWEGAPKKRGEKKLTTAIGNQVKPDVEGVRKPTNYKSVGWGVGKGKKDRGAGGGLLRTQKLFL